MVRWYALYIRSRWEKKVARELTRKSIECFLPLLRESHRWSDRSKTVEVPLFRGYVFVRTELRDRLPVLETDGVLHMIGIRGKPSPIPDEQIEWLRVLVRHPDSIQKKAGHIVGEKVRITSGPFMGVEGVIVMVKGATRLAVSIEAIQQSIVVDILSESITPVKPIGE